MKKITLEESDAVNSPAFASLFGCFTVTVRELASRLDTKIKLDCTTLTDGFEGKCLLAERGGGWKKGKFRLTLEFEPDEGETIPPPQPVSELDDIRQQLKNG